MHDTRTSIRLWLVFWQRELRKCDVLSSRLSSALWLPPLSLFESKASSLRRQKLILEACRAVYICEHTQ